MEHAWKWIDKYRIMLLAIISFGFALRLFVASVSHVYWSDEIIVPAISRHVYYGYNGIFPTDCSRGTLYVWLLATFYKIYATIFSPMPYPEVLARWERAGWVFAARVFNVFVSTFSIYLTYLVGKNLYNRNVGILAAFLQSFNWMLIRVDSAAFWETPGTMFILATLAVFTMPMKNMKLKVGLSGFLLGCAFSSRFPMGLFLIPFVGFFAWKKQWSQLTTFLVGFSIMTLVEGVVQYIVGHGFFGATLTFFTFNVVTMESAKFWGASPWYTYIEALVSNLGVTIYLVIFSLKKDEMSFLLSSMIILYLAVFSYVQHKEPRYITCLIPLLCPLMAAGAFKIERNYAILFILPYFIYNLAVIIFW